MRFIPLRQNAYLGAGLRVSLCRTEVVCLREQLLTCAGDFPPPAGSGYKIGRNFDVGKRKSIVLVPAAWFRLCSLSGLHPA